MRAGKLNLVILAAVAGGMVWVEHSHRITAEATAPADVASGNAAICPENESAPFSADCMTFIQGGAGPNVDPRANAADRALADSPELP
jgi:uncharacterized membrane protein